MPSLAAAPDNPDTLPLVWVRAASINLFRRARTFQLTPDLRTGLAPAHPIANSYQSEKRLADKKGRCETCTR
jgi:hypothetical protein